MKGNLFTNKIVTNLSLEIAEDKELVVKTKNIAKKPPYIMLGRRFLDMKRFKLDENIEIELIDTINLFSSFTPQEWFTFKILINNTIYRDPVLHSIYTTCKINIDLKKCLDNKTKINRFSIGFKRLEEKGVVLRIKKGGHFFINPLIVIPKFFEIEFKEWRELTAKQKRNIHGLLNNTN